jgi:hypothetical protein
MVVFASDSNGKDVLGINYKWGRLSLSAWCFLHQKMKGWMCCESVIGGGDSSCVHGVFLHQTVTRWSANAAFRQPLCLSVQHGTLWYVWIAMCSIVQQQGSRCSWHGWYGGCIFIYWSVTVTLTLLYWGGQ